MINTKAIVHVVDDVATNSYAEREPITVAAVELGDTRTLMMVPMLKDDELIGAFTLARQEVRPFTYKQIALVQSFAAQAVIAIENARLLGELRERTNQLEAQSREVVKLNQQLEQRVAEQVGEIERMSRLNGFCRRNRRCGGGERRATSLLESHRREVAALFCDLRGFTAFTERAEPEEVMRV